MCKSEDFPIPKIKSLLINPNKLPAEAKKCDGVYFIKQHRISSNFEEEQSFVRDFYQEYKERPDVYVRDSNLRGVYPAPPAEMDELCRNVPPQDIPELTESLREFISFLDEESSKRSIPKGLFEYSVPEDLKEDYHNLSEYRAKFIRDSLCFAWAGYREHAWGKDEIKPITGVGENRWGGIGMTILDSVDTLILMGLNQEEKLARSFVC